MQVHYSLIDFIKLEHAVATIGTFDGVHLGHQKILSTLISTAKLKSSPSVVITFWPHPRQVLQPDNKSLKILYTLPERIELLKDLGIDHLIVIPFDIAFSKTSSQDFVTKIIMEIIGANTLILGYDHRFGNNRSGSFEYLQTHADSYGLTLIEISRQDIDAVGISSSRIREAIAKGEIEEANRLLGHSFHLTGKVIQGDMIGRKIGFPTANVMLGDAHKTIPPDGVYAVWVTHADIQYKGMMNIGYRPTVNGAIHRLEVHILDFNLDIYDQEIKITFKEKLRDERKFEGLALLMEQLQKDKLATISVLSHS